MLLPGLLALRPRFSCPLYTFQAHLPLKLDPPTSTSNATQTCPQANLEVIRQLRFPPPVTLTCVTLTKSNEHTDLI